MPKATLDDKTWRRLRSVLDEEIARLPENYQAAIVVCYLEGKSQARAARELGWPKTVLANRLPRARELLRRNLARRGIPLSAGALMIALCDKAVGAPVSARLIINTVKAAICFAAGQAVSTAYVSAAAIALAEETLKGMVGVRLKAL